MPQEVRGVVALSKGAPVTVETIVIHDPGPGEVVVAVQACGVCHTDLHHREGGINDEFPFMLGHETAGVVETVGEGLTDVAPGDYVVLNWRAVCGQCRACARGDLQYCFDTHNRHAEDDPAGRHGTARRWRRRSASAPSPTRRWWPRGSARRWTRTRTRPPRAHRLRRDGQLGRRGQHRPGQEGAVDRGHRLRRRRGRRDRGSDLRRRDDGHRRRPSWPASWTRPTPPPRASSGVTSAARTGDAMAPISCHTSSWLASPALPGLGSRPCPHDSWHTAQACAVGKPWNYVERHAVDKGRHG